MTVPDHHDHDHKHDHDHDHTHPGITKDEEPYGYYATLELAVRELLIEAGLITADEHRRQIEILDSRSPVLGAKVVARAWTDPEFKKRLLADGSAACEELGITMYDGAHLIVHENTDQVHNMVVCTLCSCYPRPVLGLPPDWYKNKQYRARAVKEPRAVLKEFGTTIPDQVSIHVHDSNANMRYLILPLRPAGTEHLTEEELASLVTRDAMIGVTIVKSSLVQTNRGQA
ncbi:nitrile hydratase subunit alpha [Polynucleobacter paneuropaeus]|nr:nitrile hydratase subunit alpha [Polynucleobacter paneuropaeus]